MFFRQRRAQFVRIISLVLCETMLLGNVSYANELDISRFQGRVLDKFKGSDKKVIVHIKDAHCNYDAQSNIYKILKKLAVQDYNVIGVEGAEGKIEAADISSFPDADVRNRVSDFFLKEGQISGAEYFVLNHPDASQRVVGVEDKKMYLLNYQALVRSLEVRSTAKSYCKSLSVILNKIKSHLFFGDLADIDKVYQDYLDGKIKFYKFSSFLNKFVKKYEVDLWLYENYNLMVDAYLLEEKIDFKLLVDERREIVDTLVKTLPRDQSVDLLKYNLAYKLNKAKPKDFHHHLVDKSREYSISIKRYGQFNSYVSYLDLYEKIDMKSLFDETEDILEAIKNKLYVKDEQRDLDKISKTVNVLQNFFDLKLSPRDLKYYVDNKESFKTDSIIKFIDFYANKFQFMYFVDSNLSLVDNSLPLLEEFYITSKKRDRLLVENMLTEMDLEGSSKGVLVTGGFHTEGITNILKERGISYYVVSPVIHKSDDKKAYISMMMNERSPFAIRLEDVLQQTSALAVSSMLGNPPLVHEESARSFKVALKGLMVADAIFGFAGQERDITSPKGIEDFTRLINTFLMEGWAKGSFPELTRINITPSLDGGINVTLVIGDQPFAFIGFSKQEVKGIQSLYFADISGNSISVLDEKSADALAERNDKIAIALLPLLNNGVTTKVSYIESLIARMKEMPESLNSQEQKVLSVFKTQGININNINAALVLTRMSDAGLVRFDNRETVSVTELSSSLLQMRNELILKLLRSNILSYFTAQDDVSTILNLLADKEIDWDFIVANVAKLDSMRFSSITEFINSVKLAGILEEKVLSGKYNWKLDEESLVPAYVNDFFVKNGVSAVDIENGVARHFWFEFFKNPPVDISGKVIVRVNGKTYSVVKISNLGGGAFLKVRIESDEPDRLRDEIEKRREPINRATDKIVSGREAPSVEIPSQPIRPEKITTSTDLNLNIPVDNKYFKAEVVDNNKIQVSFLRNKELGIGFINVAKVDLNEAGDILTVTHEDGGLSHIYSDGKIEFKGMNPKSAWEQMRQPADLAQAKEKEYRRRIDELELISEASTESSTCPNLLNVRSMQERLVKTVEAGTDVVSAYIKVQNFKDVFNTFGAEELGQGHFLGDAGIMAVGNVLKGMVEAKASQLGMEVDVANAGGEFFITFKNVGDTDISKLLEDLLGSEFRQKVRDETVKEFENVIRNDQEFAKLNEKLTKGFTADKVNFYAGVSTSSLVHKDASAPQIADVLFKESFQAAKHCQLSFSDKFNDVLISDAMKLIEKDVSPDEIDKLFEDVLSESREALKTGVRKYSGEIDALMEKGILEREYEVLQQSIADVYDPKLTVANLLSEYREAVDRDASMAEISEIKNKLLDSVLRYETRNLKGEFIFVGNDHFKRVMNHILQNPPDHDVALTFRVGGDEYGKLVWDNNKRKIIVYRFDGNNVGATSREWGMAIGDKLIDESLRIISFNTNIKDLPSEVTAFFNDMGSRAVELSNKEYTSMVQRAKNLLKVYQIEDQERIKNETSDLLIISEDIYNGLRDAGTFQEYTKDISAVIVEKADKTNVLMKFPDIHAPYVIENTEANVRKSDIPKNETTVSILANKVGKEGDVGAFDIRMMSNPNNPKEFLINTIGSRAPPITVTQAMLDSSKPINLNIDGYEPVKITISEDQYNYQISVTDGKLISIPAKGFLEQQQQGKIVKKIDSYAVLVTTRPVVSTGVVEIDVDKIRPEDRLRDISVIQGRADGAAETAKEAVKRYQIINDGRIQENLAVKNGVSLSGTVQEVVRVMSSFKQHEQTKWDKVVAEYILDQYKQVRMNDTEKTSELSEKLFGYDGFGDAASNDVWDDLLGRDDSGLKDDKSLARKSVKDRVNSSIKEIIERGDGLKFSLADINKMSAEDFAANLLSGDTVEVGRRLQQMFTGLSAGAVASLVFRMREEGDMVRRSLVLLIKTLQDSPFSEDFEQYGISLLFDDKGIFGTGDVLAHAGRDQTFHVNYNVLKYVLSLPESDQKSAVAILRTIMEHELRDMKRAHYGAENSHRDDIGKLDPVSDPTNFGEIIDFDKVRSFWDNCQHFLIGNRVDSIKNVTVENVQDVEDVLFSYTSYLKKMKPDVIQADDLANTADRLFDDLMGYYDVLLKEKMQELIRTKGAKTTLSELKTIRKNLTKAIHPDRIDLFVSGGSVSHRKSLMEQIDALGKVLTTFDQKRSTWQDNLFEVYKKFPKVFAGLELVYIKDATVDLSLERTKISNAVEGMKSEARQFVEMVDSTIQQFEKIRNINLNKEKSALKVLLQRAKTFSEQGMGTRIESYLQVYMDVLSSVVEGRKKQISLIDAKREKWKELKNKIDRQVEKDSTLFKMYLHDREKLDPETQQDMIDNLTKKMKVTAVRLKFLTGRGGMMGLELAEDNVKQKFGLEGFKYDQVQISDNLKELFDARMKKEDTYNRYRDAISSLRSKVLEIRKRYTESKLLIYNEIKNIEETELLLPKKQRQPISKRLEETLSELEITLQALRLKVESWEDARGDELVPLKKEEVAGMVIKASPQEDAQQTDQMLESRADLQAERRTAETVVNWIDNELIRLKGLEQNIKKIDGFYQSAYTGVWNALADGVSLSNREQSDLTDRTKALNVFSFIKTQIIPNGELLFKNVDWGKLLKNPEFVSILRGNGVGIVSMLDSEAAELARLNKLSLEDAEDLVRQMELGRKKDDINRVAVVPVQGKDISAIVKPKNMTENMFAEMYDAFVNYLLTSKMESATPEIRSDVLGLFDYLVNEDNIVKLQKNFESLDAKERLKRGQVLHVAFRDTVLPMIQSLIEYRVGELQSKKAEMERVKQLKMDKINEIDQKLKQLRTPKEKIVGIGKKISQLMKGQEEKTNVIKMLPRRSEDTETIDENIFPEKYDFKEAASKDEDKDKNLARKYIKNKIDVDAEIAKNIEEGKAVRISLEDLTLRSAGDIINKIFEGTPENTTYELQSLFGKMPTAISNKMIEQLSDELTRERIKKALILALNILKSSQYKDKLTEHSLTLLLDWDGVFYEGGVLAHTGTSRQTVYLNLSTLMHIEEMEPTEKAAAKRVLLSVFEHEYRDWERSMDGQAPHQEDIGVIDPVFHQGKKITFKDVDKFWKGLENRVKEKIVQREVDGESRQYVSIKQNGLSSFVVSNKVLSELGIFTAGKFLSLLSRASALDGKKLSKLFSEKAQKEIVIDDIETFKNEYGIDLKRFSNKIPMEDLEPFESTPINEIKHADQLKDLKLSSDYFIVSPVYNLLSRDDPDLLENIMKHAHEKGYVNKLLIIDDASTDGTQELLKKLNRGYNLRILTESLDEINTQIQASDLSKTERKILTNRRVLIMNRLDYYKNPKSPVYDFNMVLREENGHRTGAIRDTILGLYSLAQQGEIKQLPEKLFIMDGDSFIQGEDINAQLGDAADTIGNVDVNGDRTIACILPVTTHYGKLSWSKSSFMEKLNYAQFVWLRSISALIAKSVPGGGGGYSLPYLVRALKKHSGIFETDDAELSGLLRENKNTKFKFFASKTMRVVTDMPEKIADKWTQGRRWAGGAFQMLRKYGKDLPKGMYKTTMTAMAAFSVLSVTTPIFVIKPLIALAMSSGLSFVLPLGILFAAGAYLIFMLPVLLFNKDAFNSEKIYPLVLAPIMGVNFLIFTISAMLSEFYLAVYDILLARPIKNYVIPPLNSVLEYTSQKVSESILVPLSRMLLLNESGYSVLAVNTVLTAVLVGIVFVKGFLSGDVTPVGSTKDLAEASFGSVGLLFGAFIRKMDSPEDDQYGERAELNLIAEASIKSSTSPELLNVRVIKERVVKSIQSGQDVVSAYIKIQNFKDVFNTFGAEILGQSHFLGDAGINAMGKVLKKVIEKEANKRKMSVEIANAGGEFFLAFSNVGNNDVNQILTDMLNSDFSEQVRKETIKEFKKLLNNKKLFKQLELLLYEGFTVDKIGFYGGVSTNSKDHKENAPELSDILFTESFQAAKHCQLNFSDSFSQQLANARDLMGKGASPDEIDEIFNNVLSESREASKTGIRKYTREINDLMNAGFLEREYQVLQKSIADNYDPAMTIDNLLASYKNAVEFGASQLEISQIKDKLLDSVLKYETKNLKGEFIFAGNDHFKRVMNYILQNQPDHDVALTFRVGGDEYGKLVWDNDRKKMIVYRFDGNNVGATSREWGMGIGDKLIDESLRVISSNQDIRNLPAEVTAFFNDMGTRAVLLNNKEYTSMIQRAKDSLILDDTAQDEDLERIKTEGKDLLMITDAIYKKLKEKGNFQEYTKDTSIVLMKRFDGSVVLVKFPDIHAPYVIENDETEARKSDIQSKEVRLSLLANKIGKEDVGAIDIRIMVDPDKPGEFLIKTRGSRAPPITVTQSVVDGVKQYILNFEGYKPVKITIGEDDYNYRFNFTDGKLISIPADIFSELQQQGKIVKQNDEYVILVTTRPVVSSGIVEIDVGKISPEDLLRDISVIQGRADSAAEIAKANVKRYQVINEGRIKENLAVRDGNHLAGGADQVAKYMGSFKKHEQSQWDKIVAEHILDKYRQQNEVDDMGDIIKVDFDRGEFGRGEFRQAASGDIWGDKNLARRNVKGEINNAIQNDILNGNAIRISLKSLQKGKTPAQVVNSLFEGSPQKIAKNLQKLFDKLPADGVQQMLDRVSDPIQRDKIRKGLIIALESIKQSKYINELGNFSLTLLLDEKGVFYSGDALSRVGTERKTIYINLNTLLNVVEMEFPEQELAVNILRAVFEHEFRDWVRSLILRDGTEVIKKDPVLKLLSYRSDIDWFEAVPMNYDAGILTSAHVDDIGVFDVITFAGFDIDFDLVDLFWRNIVPKKDISQELKQALSSMNFDNISERSKIRTLQAIAEEYADEQSKKILDKMADNYQMYMIVYSPAEAVRKVKQEAEKDFEELRNSLYQMEKDYGVEFSDIIENIMAIIWLVDEFNRNIGFLRGEDSYKNLHILKSLNYRDLSENGYLYLIRRVMDLKINMSVFFDVQEDGFNLKAYESVLKGIMALPDEIIDDLPEWGNILTLSQANWVDSSGRINVGALYDGGVYVSLSEESKYSPTAILVHEFVGHYRLMKLIESAKRSDKEMIKLEETISPENIIDILKSCTKAGAESDVRFVCKLNIPDKYFSGPKSVMDKFNATVSAESLKLKMKDVFWDKSSVDLFASDKVLSADEQFINPVVLENISIEFLTWAAKNNKYLFWELVYKGMWFDLPANQKDGVVEGDDKYYTDILEIISFAVMDGDIPSKKLTNPNYQYNKKAVREILTQNYLKGWAWTQENGWVKKITGLEDAGMAKLVEQKLIKTDEPLRSEIPMTENGLLDYLSSIERYSFSKEILDGFKGYLVGLEERHDYIKSQIKNLGVDDVKYDGGMSYVENLINGLIDSVEQWGENTDVLNIELPGIDKNVFVYLVDETALAKLDRASYTLNEKNLIKIFLPVQLAKSKNPDTFFQLLKHQIDMNIYGGIKDQAVLLEPLFGTNKKAEAGDVSARVVYEFSQRIKNTKDLNKLNEFVTYFKDIVKNKSTQLQKIRDSRNLTPEQQEVAERLVLNMAQVAMAMSVKAETAIVEAGGEIRGFRFIEKLGEGTYSNVYLAEKDGVKYAVKVFRDKDGEHGASVKNLIFSEYHKKMEGKILQRAYDDSFVSGDYINGESLFLVVPYMEGMSLNKNMRQFPVDKSNRIYLAMTILGEIRRRIDNNYIIHNDIKPQNILVSEDANKARIIDFGTSWEVGYVPSTLMQASIAYTKDYASPETRTLRNSVLKVIKILRIVNDKSPAAEKADKFEQAFQSLLQKYSQSDYSYEFKDTVEASFARLKLDIAGVVSKLRRGENVPFQQVVELLEKDILRVLFLTIDIRSDVYSFGKILEDDFFDKHKFGDDVTDDALDRIIAKATSRDKEDRFQSFNELEEAFYEYFEKDDDAEKYADDLIDWDMYVDKPPVDPSLSATEIDKLKISDWVAEDLMSEFEKMNNGPLKTIYVTGDAISLIDEIQAKLKDIDDEEYVSVIIHKTSPFFPEFGEMFSYKVAIDKAGRFKEKMHIMMGGLRLYSYMYVMDFSVFKKMNDLHMHSISLGSEEDEEALRGRKLVSKTFEKIVKIFKSFYPYQISTFATSPSTEHWFKKYFNASHVDAEGYESLKPYIDVDITDEEDYEDLMIGRISRNPDPSGGDINIADVGLDAPEHEQVNDVIRKAAQEGRLEQKETVNGKKVYIVKGVDTLVGDQKGHAGIENNAIYVAEGAYNKQLVLHEAVELEKWQDKAIRLGKMAGILETDKIGWGGLNAQKRKALKENLRKWMVENYADAVKLEKRYHEFAEREASASENQEIVPDPIADFISVLSRKRIIPDQNSEEIEFHNAFGVRLAEHIPSDGNYFKYKPEEGIAEFVNDNFVDGESYFYTGPVIKVHGSTRNGVMYIGNEPAADVINRIAKKEGLKKLLLVVCNPCNGKLGKVDIPIIHSTAVATHGVNYYGAYGKWVTNDSRSVREFIDDNWLNLADVGLDSPEHELVNDAIANAAQEGRLLEKGKINGKRIFVVKGADFLNGNQRGHAGIERNAIYIAENAYNQDRNLVVHEAFELQQWQNKAIELAKESGIILADKVVSDWIQDLTSAERAEITRNLRTWISNNKDQAKSLMEKFHNRAMKIAPVGHADEAVKDDRMTKTFKEPEKTGFSNNDLKDFILLYSDLPVTKLLFRLAKANRNFNDFSETLYQKIQRKYNLGSDVKKATILEIQDFISSLVRIELNALGNDKINQADIDPNMMVRVVISQAINHAGGMEKLISQGLKAKIVDAGIEKIKEKAELIKTTEPEKSEQLLSVYGFLKNNQIKLVVIPSMDGSYGISTTKEGYQFTYSSEVEGERVVFVGEGLYDALLSGGIEEFLVHIGMREYQKSLPAAIRLDEISANMAASVLRGYFGNTLSGLIENLTFKGLENQRYMPLLNRIMSLGNMNIDKISLSPSTINEIITSLREIFDLEIDFDVSNLPDESQFKVSPELLSKSLSIINTAIAKPDIFLFPKELVTGKISPSNFSVRQTLEKFREENRNKEGRNAVFIAVSLDTETVSQFRDTLDKTISRRESVDSNEIFDFVVNVKSVNELIDLIKTEYPTLAESDLLNRLKMIDTSSGKLSDYADKNGYRYQTFDSDLAMDSMRDTGRTVFLMDIMRAFGTKQVPKNIKIVNVRENIAIEESYQEQFSGLVSVFLAFVSKLKAMPGKQWTYQQLIDTFYTDIYATLTSETKAKFRGIDQVVNAFKQEELLDKQVGYDGLWKAFVKYLKPNIVARPNLEYFVGKLKEQQDLYVIKRVYDNLSNISDSVTIDTLLRGLNSIGTISINQNHAKYLQIEANARSVNSSVIDTINQISAIDEAA